MNIKSKEQVIKSIALSIFINGLIPLIVYSIMLKYYSSKISLIIATIIPLVDNLYHIIKEKKVDAFAMFMLVGFLLSILMFFLGGNEKVILLRESIVTGLLGTIFIGSLFFNKPLIYYFAIRFSGDNAENKRALFDNQWNIHYFRSVIRIMTGVWGMALLGEAVIKVILVFSLSIPVFLVVSQFVFYGVISITIVWTIFYKKYAKKQLDMLVGDK